MLRLSSAALIAATFAAPLFAQAQPIGLTHPGAQPLDTVASTSVPALDRGRIANEDNNRAANGQPARFAIPHDVAIDPATGGTWQVLDNTWSLWRLRIRAPGASHVNLGFEAFRMPANARMQIYSTDGSHVVRPFDANDHQPTGVLWTPVVLGDDIICEVYVPTASKPQVQLDLVHVGSGYRFFGAGPTALSGAIDGSGSCNIDVNCPQGAGWESEISAVAAISTGGSIFCTGCMINNTAQNGRNFFLTADHCGVSAGAAPSLVCYWNYDRSGCGFGSEPLNMFTLGSTHRADWGTSDFTLVELNSTPNPAWGVTYAGWNRGAGNATSAVAIHHPSGDSKKISFENQATQTTGYGSSSPNPNGSHVRVVDWDLGTTEGGSSGSPLFDQNHRIIGQLHGGGAACGNNLSDWYGRFHRSWTGGGSNGSRLSNWLDPLNTGQLTLNTLGGGDVAAATAYGTGCYETFGSFGEEFAGGSFDLGGTPTFTRVIRLTRSAVGYDVGDAPSTWFNPMSGDLGLDDDDLHTVVLPWTLSTPAGSVIVIRFCTNGFVWLNSSSSSTDWSPSMSEFLDNPARLAPGWVDLNPTAGGSCHYDVDPSGTAVYFTWNNVPAYTAGPTGAGNTMQVALFQNGNVEYRYRSLTNQPNEMVVGFAGGFTNTPPVIDLTTALPLAVSVDGDGIEWAGVNRPILGTTQTLQISGISNPTQSIGLAVLGTTQFAGGVDLASIGSSGCRLYLQASVLQVMPFPILTSTQNYALPIPNNPSLSGTHIYTQGAILEPPSQNPSGIRTTNGVDLLLGTL